MVTAFRRLVESLLIVALVGSTPSTQSSGNSLPVNLTVGMDGNAIASAFEAAWSQGAFTCNVPASNPSTLFVFDTLGNCDNAIARFNFDVASGTLLGNHNGVVLKLFCASPLNADINFGAGDLPINLGFNSYTVGPDTIEIILSHPSTSITGGPALPPALLILLTLAGAVWIGRMAKRAKANA